MHIETELKAIASEDLKASIEAELKLPDPDEQRSQAAIKDNKIGDSNAC